MKRLIVVFFLGVSSGSYAQLISFLNVYGNSGYDYGRDIKEYLDSGFVVTGSSSSFGSENADVFLMKVNKYGDFLWSKNYGGFDSDWGESIIITNDSGLAIGGYTNSYGSGGFDFYLIRTDDAGTKLWEKTYGGSDWDQAYDLVQTPDSGFVLVGYTYSFGGNKDAYIVKTNSEGDTIWTKVIGQSGEDFLEAVYLDGDSIVVCGGSSSYGTGGLDGFICKMDMDGNIGWQKYIGSIGNDYFTSISHFDDYYTLGGVRGYNYINTGDDMWFYKLSDDGLTEIVDTTYVNTCVEDDGINDVGINPANQDIFFAGHTESYGFLMDGMPDMFFGKMTSTSVFVTASTYGEAGEDKLYALDLCMDEGVVFVGDTKYYSTGGNNIVILKLTLLWDYPNQFTDLTFNDITNSIDIAQTSDNFAIWPNPTYDNIQYSYSSEFDFVEVYSSDGKLLIHSEDKSGFLSTADLAKGVYLISFSFGDEIYTQRIIKY